MSGVGFGETMWNPPPDKGEQRRVEHVQTRYATIADKIHIPSSPVKQPEQVLSRLRAWLVETAGQSLVAEVSEDNQLVFLSLTPPDPPHRTASVRLDEMEKRLRVLEVEAGCLSPKNRLP